MPTRTQIIIGGKDTLKALKDIAARKELVSWSCGKNTKAGDFLFFYAMKPTSAIVATGIAASKARPHKKWHYVTDIENLEIIKNPIPLQELLVELPKWGWPRQPRRPTYPRDYIVRKIEQLAKRRLVTTTIHPEKRIDNGAGFGHSERNRLVEQAACKEVKKHFENLGYKVISREKENLGYDFDVIKGSETIHLEVKGISGSALKFPITANEVACARRDSKFKLAVVTEAMTSQKRVHIFSRKDFLKGFKLTPFAYFAEAKESLRA